MKQIAKIILLNDENEFLFQLRDNYTHIIEPGIWSLFGGEIKKGESVLMGLKREINEEIPACFVSDIIFLGKGYNEIIDLKLKNYWTNKDKKPDNSEGYLEISVFKGKINEGIDSINSKITEGQKAGYFKLDEFNDIGLCSFTKDFIYQNKNEIFS